MKKPLESSGRTHVEGALPRYGSPSVKSDPEEQMLPDELRTFIEEGRDHGERANLDVSAVSSGAVDTSVDLLPPVALDMLLTLGDELDENHSCDSKIGYALESRRPILGRRSRTTLLIRSADNTQKREGCTKICKLPIPHCA